MPINPNIAMSFQPPQFESPGNMMTRMAQMQALQDASEEKQLAIEQRRRLQSERGMLNKMLEADGYEPTPRVLSFMTGMLDPKMAEAGVQGLQQYARQKGLKDLFAAPTAPPEFAVGAPTNFLAGGEREARPLSIDTPNQLKGFAAPVEGDYLTPGLTTPNTKSFSVGNGMMPVRPSNALAETVGGSQEINTLKDRYQKLTGYAAVNAGTKEAEQALQQARLIQDRIHHLTPKPEVNPEIVKLQEIRKRLSPNDPMYKELTARINFLGTGPQPSASASDRFVKVDSIDNGDGTYTIVERDRDTNKLRLSKVDAGKVAKQPGALTDKDRLKLKKELANDFTAHNAIVDTSNDTVSLVGELEKHPGLKGITGLSGMVPSFPGGDAAAAEAIERSLKGKVTQLGKQIADSSGKIGPMALGEWKVVSDMVTSLDRTKGTDVYLAQLQDIRDALIKLTSRSGERFSGLYEDQLENYPQFSQPKVFNPDYKSTSAQRTEEKRAAPAAAPKPAAAPTPAAPKPAAAAIKLPKAGDVVDGYLFKGGAPNDQKNWVKQ
jgi:hypothetical protein